MNGTGEGPAGTGDSVSGGPAVDPDLYVQESNGRQTSPFGITTRTGKTSTSKKAVGAKLQLWVDERQTQILAQGMTQEPYILKQIAYKKKIQEEQAESVATSSTH